MSIRRLPLLFLILAAAFAAPAFTQARDAGPAGSSAGQIFDDVARTLSAYLTDEEFRKQRMPPLIDEFRPRAKAAVSPDAEKAIVDEFLSHIPFSHVALMSRHAWTAMSAHLGNIEVATIGFELIELEGSHFVHALLQGSPAAEAGVLMGDRVVMIDGVPTAASPRLDRPSNDAYPPGGRVLRGLIADLGETIAFELERTPGEFIEADITTRLMRAIDASRETTVFERGGHRIGYMQLHYVHMEDAERVIAANIDGPLRGCAVFIIDLRGRGGSAPMAQRIVRVLHRLKTRRGVPIIAIIDGQTRSAKEVIAWELRQRNIATLIGERTAGALLPATFVEVGEDAVLMFPMMPLHRYSELIEGVGVEPHVHVEPVRIFTNGQDPLVERAIVEAERIASKPKPILDEAKEHLMNHK